MHTQVTSTPHEAQVAADEVRVTSGFLQAPQGNLCTPAKPRSDYLPQMLYPHTQTCCISSLYTAKRYIQLLTQQRQFATATPTSAGSTFGSRMLHQTPSHVLFATASNATTTPFLLSQVSYFNSATSGTAQFSCTDTTVWQGVHTHAL